MDTPLRLGDRHPLNPVDAAFVFQTTVGAPSRDQGNHLLEAPHPACGRAVHDLDLPAGGFREAGIHPEEVLRKKARLIPARSGPDLEENVLLIVRIPWQQQDLQPFRERFQGFLQLGQFFPDELLQLLVALPEQRLVLLDADPGFFIFAKGFDKRIEVGMLLGVFLIDPGLADNGRVAQKLFQIPVPGFDILQSRKHCSLLIHPPRSPPRERVRASRTQRAVLAGSCSCLWNERFPERRRRQPGAIPKLQRQGNPRPPTPEPHWEKSKGAQKNPMPFSPGRRTSCENAPRVPRYPRFSVSPS